MHREGPASAVCSVGRGVVPGLAMMEHDAAGREVDDGGFRHVDLISDV